MEADNCEIENLVIDINYLISRLIFLQLLNHPRNVVQQKKIVVQATANSSRNANRNWSPSTTGPRDVLTGLPWRD